jgi:hypothetical protein
LDHYNFEPLGRWEVDRGPQYFGYDFAWHLGHDIAVTSEWGTPNMVENGVNPELLLGGKYRHSLHIWDLRKRRHLQSLDLGADSRWSLSCAADDPTKAYGFVGVVTSLKDLSSSIWLWHRPSGGSNGGSNGRFEIKKVIEIPAEPADPSQIPALSQGFKAVPPLLTDINLSVDDRFLYASCWGTGEMRQYDVSDPFNPKLISSVHVGGIVRRASHPAKPGEPLNGGPQMVEISRDGRRVYFTNSLYAAWDKQFYPDGIRGWMVKLEVAQDGGIQLDPKLFVDFGDLRGHQVKLPGWRRLVRLLLLPMSHSWPWVALAVLGAYHGLNRAMGWLFALALGLQEKRRSAVVGALLPIAVGHAAAITAAILALRFVQHFLPMNILKWGVALFLFTLGVYRLFRANHPRRAGMRVGGRDLFVWSFLMASAHGAGLCSCQF